MGKIPTSLKTHVSWSVEGVKLNPDYVNSNKLMDWGEQRLEPYVASKISLGVSDPAFFGSGNQNLLIYGMLAGSGNPIGYAVETPLLD